MERIRVLIDKLYQQKQNSESIAQMLMTVQLLQTELQSLQTNTKVLGSSKVSVILPCTPVVTAAPEAKNNTVVQEEKPEVKPIEENHLKYIPKEAPEPKQQPVRTEYVLQKPVVAETKPEPATPSNAPLFNHPADVVVEAPTLVQQQIHKEIHELITNHQESLNDKLKQDRTELAHKLKDTPVKDLRKAIGINDKFALINELFRGDEAMYERSIKTINSFHILPEAEYWINRELKVKLGWNDNKEIVQHFYQLVRRRFS